MGLTLCESYDSTSYHASVSYDIQTANQGVVFVGYAVVCLIFESIFLVLTLRFFYRDPKLCSNLYAVVFYVSFHLSLLTTALYFVGGIICYGLKTYNFLSTASYLLQGTAVFSVTLNMLETLLPLWCPNAIWGTRCFVPLFALYVGGFLVIFMVEVKENKLYNFYLFNLCSSLLFAIGFYLVAKRLSKELLNKYPSLLPPPKQRIWNGVAVTITSLMITRAVCAFCDYMGLTFYLKKNNLPIFTLYSIVLSLLFDLFPCVVLVFFIKIQTQSIERSQSIEEIMSNLEGKTTCFSKPSNGTLMEEMVGDENCKEDSI